MNYDQWKLQSPPEYDAPDFDCDEPEPDSEPATNSWPLGTMCRAEPDDGRRFMVVRDTGGFVVQTEIVGTVDPGAGGLPHRMPMARAWLVPTETGFYDRLFGPEPNYDREDFADECERDYGERYSMHDGDDD